MKEDMIVTNMKIINSLDNKPVESKSATDIASKQFVISPFNICTKYSLLVLEFVSTNKVGPQESKPGIKRILNYF